MCAAPVSSSSSSLREQKGFVRQRPGMPIIVITKSLFDCHRRISAEQLVQCQEQSLKYSSRAAGHDIPDNINGVFQNLGLGRSSVYLMPSYDVDSDKKVCKRIPRRQNLNDRIKNALLEIRLLCTLKGNPLFPQLIASFMRDACRCNELLPEGQIMPPIHYPFEATLIMPKAPGEDVATWIQAGHRLDTYEKIHRFTEQMFHGENTLNKYCVTHGNPTPGNFLWCSVINKLTIVGLGNAISLYETVGSLENTCTAIYCPPEMRNQPEGPIETGMIFSFGATLFEAVTREPLIDFSKIYVSDRETLDGANKYYEERLALHKKRKAPSAAAESPVAPIENWSVVLSRSLADFSPLDTEKTISLFIYLLALEPKGRFANAATVLQSIEGALSHEEANVELVQL